MLASGTAATRLKVLIFLRIQKVHIVFFDQSGYKALELEEGVGAETAGSSNRSGDEIDMEAEVRSCALRIANIMRLAVVLALSFLSAGTSKQTFLYTYQSTHLPVLRFLSTIVIFYLPNFILNQVLHRKCT